MPLDIQQREREDILILDLQGDLTVGETATHLTDTLKTLEAAGRLNVILNMAGVDYIDSTGLGSMVVSFTGLRKSGGKLALLNLRQRSIELLVMTKLATVFETFTDEQDAVNSYFPERKIERFDILAFVQKQRKEGESPE
jgi:anti-sigma B factor antagonist